MAGPPGLEDPISAIFELADKAAGMGPVVRRLYRYTAAILTIWIAIMIVVIVVGLAGAGWLAVLALLGLAAGVVALGLLRQTDAFFREFVRRYRWIHLLRDAEPTARVPEGRTPMERLVRYLQASNPTVAAWLTAHPEALRYQATFGATPRAVSFDMVLVRPGGTGARWFGLGDPGFAIVARLGTERPSLEELRRFEGDVVAAAPLLEGMLARVVLVRPGGSALEEPVYEYAVGHPVVARWGRARTRAVLEIVTEGSDGAYDFVPHVVGVP